MYWISRPDGAGIIIIGKMAATALQEATRLAIDRSSWHGRLDENLVHSAVKKGISKDFIEGRKEVNDRNCDRLFNRALKQISEKMVNAKYMVPCNITGADFPAEFTLGPIEFMLRDDFFHQYNAQLKENTKSEFGAQLDDSMQSYFAQFSCVAQVKLDGYCQEVGQKLANDLGPVDNRACSFCCFLIQECKRGGFDEGRSFGPFR